MRSLSRIALVTGIFALAVVAAGQSREELPSQPFLSLREQSAALLNYRAVMVNLELTDQELAKVETAKAGYQSAEAKAAADQGSKETDLENMDREFARNVLGALDPAHQNRLYQALLQVKGPECLQEASVGDDLALSAAQRTRIHRLFDSVQKREEDFDAELAQAILAVPHVKPDSAYEAKKRDAIKALAPKKKLLAKERAKDEAAALAILTPAQLKIWKALLGPPFPITVYKH